MSSSKPVRADARRNRDRLVESARAVFADLGTQAPLDEVARRAGIGNATLYRHFPSRDELVVAVYADEVAELCAGGERLIGGSAEPVDALFDWLAAFVAHLTATGDLARSLEPGVRRSDLHEQWHQTIRRTATRLVEQARAAGAIRAEVDPIDLLILVGGTATAGPERVPRLLDVIRRGVVAD